MSSMPPFSRAFYHLCNALHYFYYFASSLLSLVSSPWSAFCLDHTRYQLRTYPWGEEGRRIEEEELADLPDAQLVALNSNSGVNVVGWSLTTAIRSVQQEGIVTNASRDVVDRELIKRGKDYSGIFKIVSHFKSPDGRKYMIQGTAFAVSRFHVLTSAHLMWDAKLGPATRAILYADERADQQLQHVKICIAVACNADWVRWRQAENDFCMVAVKKPFASEVRILPCHSGPDLPSVDNGVIIGFPYDLPFSAPSQQLIQCEGSVSYHKRRRVLVIEHDINTVEGNSGGPVIVGGQVVAIHSEFVHQRMKNKATAINQNDNIVDHFGAVLRCITRQLTRLPEGIEELGIVRDDTYPEQGIRLFT